jgi:hypothetical protein
MCEHVSLFNGAAGYQQQPAMTLGEFTQGLFQGEVRQPTLYHHYFALYGMIHGQKRLYAMNGDHEGDGDYQDQDRPTEPRRDPHVLAFD